MLVVMRRPLQTRIGITIFIGGLTGLAVGLVMAFPLDLVYQGEIVGIVGTYTAFVLAPQYDFRHRKPPTPPRDPST
jgi:hypothetical protein